MYLIFDRLSVLYDVQRSFAYVLDARLFEYILANNKII